MNELTTLSDNKLVVLASNGCTEAEEVLVERYLPLVEKCSRPFILFGGDDKDIIQEGSFGLISAIRNYNESTGVPFELFSKKCIRNRIISAIKSAAGAKNTPLNAALSLDDLYSDPMSDEPQCSAEEAVIAQESQQELMSDLKKALSPFEIKVLLLFLDGMNYKEISEHLNKNSKSIDNAVQRIKHKLADLSH